MAGASWQPNARLISVVALEPMTLVSNPHLHGPTHHSDSTKAMSPPSRRRSAPQLPHLIVAPNFFLAPIFTVSKKSWNGMNAGLGHYQSVGKHIYGELNVHFFLA